MSSPIAPLTPFCSTYRRAIELVGGRWTGAIIRALLSGETRFAQIAATIPGLSDRLLSERLKDLEAEGLVVREVIPTTPVRIEYHPTEKGRALLDVVRAVADWANEWMPAPDDTDCNPAPTGAERVTT